MIRILLADDHAVLVGGIEKIVQGELDMTVVAKAHHGEELLVLLTKHEADVVLLDINMPGKSGLDICSQIFEIAPHVRVLVMSMHQDSFHVITMLKKGVHGYITKKSTHHEMLEAIRTVAEGKTYFSAAAQRAVMQGVSPETAKEEGVFHLKLSRREKEVLQLIVTEFTTQEIADKLFISVKTVETHRRNLLTKLNARNTAGLVRIAIEKGLI